MSLRLTSLMRSILLCFCCAFVLSFAISLPAYAHTSSDPITVTAESDSIHFPNSIDFQVSATDSAAPITTATIYITYDADAGAAPESHTITITPHARTITTQWHEDTSSSNFQLPGTPVQYYWFIQDSAGSFYHSATQSFTTIDSRYSWQHLSSGLLQVNWYNRSQAFGQLLLQNALNALNHIKGNLGGGLLHPVNLWVYASDQDFHGALGPGTYEWVGGEAVPQLSEAFISVQDSQDDTLVRDMPHELTHLVFHQLTAQGQLAPRWFDEGLAVYNQFYHEPEMKAVFEQALVTHSLIRLQSIELEFPADANQAYLAYAESWQLVSYMYQTFGLAKMERFIQDQNNSSYLFDDAMQKALGVDTAHLENQWRLSLGQPATLSPAQLTPTPNAATTSVPAAANDTIPALTVVGVLLIVLPLLGIVAIFVFQNRKRRKTAVASYGAYGAPPVIGGQDNRYLPVIGGQDRRQSPNLNGQASTAQNQQPYVPFYYPTANGTANARYARQNAPPVAPLYPPTRANGASYPAAPQSQPRDQGEFPLTWEPFSEYSNTVRPKPDQQAPQE
jgi:hypothetical protein